MDYLGAGFTVREAELLTEVSPDLASLCNCTKSDLLTIPGIKLALIQKVSDVLGGLGLALIVSEEHVKKGEGRGVDKRYSYAERSAAGRKNNPPTVNNESHHSDRDRFTSKTVSEILGSNGLSIPSVKESTNLFMDALAGHHTGLENEMCARLAVMLHLQGVIMMEFIERGSVDIYIPVINSDGEPVYDNNNKPVLKGIKTPTGALRVLELFTNSLGLNVNDMMISAKAQNRMIGMPTISALDEVEKGLRELHTVKSS